MRYKVSFWGVRCWYDEETNMLQGLNRFHDVFIPVAIFFQNTMAAITNFLLPNWENPGFRFKILATEKAQNEPSDQPPKN